jgi:hypothetical protein
MPCCEGEQLKMHAAAECGNSARLTMKKRRRRISQLAKCLADEDDEN